MYGAAGSYATSYVTSVFSAVGEQPCAVHATTWCASVLPIKPPAAEPRRTSARSDGLLFQLVGMMRR
jgi:hypothetical protein